MDMNIDSFDCEECGKHTTQATKTEARVHVDLRDSAAFPGVIRNYCSWTCAKAASDNGWTLPADR